MQISANFTSDFSPMKYAETNIKKSAWQLGKPKQLFFLFPPLAKKLFILFPPSPKNVYLTIFGRVFESARYGQVGCP